MSFVAFPRCFSAHSPLASRNSSFRYGGPGRFTRCDSEPHPRRRARSALDPRLTQRDPSARMALRQLWERETLHPAGAAAGRAALPEMPRNGIRPAVIRVTLLDVATAAPRNLVDDPGDSRIDVA